MLFGKKHKDTDDESEAPVAADVDLSANGGGLSAPVDDPIPFSDKDPEERAQEMLDFQTEMRHIREETEALVLEEHPETVRKDTVEYEHTTLDTEKDAGDSDEDESEDTDDTSTHDGDEEETEDEDDEDTSIDEDDKRKDEDANDEQEETVDEEDEEKEEDTDEEDKADDDEEKDEDKV